MKTVRLSDTELLEHLKKQVSEHGYDVVGFGIAREAPKALLAVTVEPRKGTLKISAYDYPFEQESVIKAKKERIDANAHKGNSWKDKGITQHLFEKLDEEYNEVAMAKRAVDSHEIIYPHVNAQMIKELADLANICEMLIWHYSQRGESK